MRITVTAEDIAKGVAKSPNHCPIAQALLREGRSGVLVGHFKISYLANGMEFVYNTPPEAQRFIKRFDCGNEVLPTEFLVAFKEARNPNDYPN